jgi:5-formyltetrahydrofolate cyclo-ligase
MMGKAALRRHARAARAAVQPKAPLPPPAEFLALIRPGMVVASYVALGDEADPALLAHAAADRGAGLALPHVVDRATPLTFRSWTGRSDDLVPGPFGLSQPAADAPAVAPDLILTPLVAFDAGLNRLGQGAGHYDRAFAAWPQAIRIGVAFAAQEVPALPLDPWDLPLHGLVTDAGWRTR